MLGETEVTYETCDACILVRDSEIWAILSNLMNVTPIRKTSVATHPKNSRNCNFYFLNKRTVSAPFISILKHFS